jgi:DNA polymerase/3'-5' exonuclease PolX
MSNAPKRPFEDVLAVALEVRDLLAPACEQIYIAGSLRREVRMISDIEIVAIPRTHQQVDLFGVETGTISELDELLSGMSLTFSKNGDRYKKYSYQGYQVDLFLANAANLGFILMLRTGPADYSKAMVTLRPYGFKPLHIRVADGYVYQIPNAAAPIPVPDEETLFRLWGLDYVEPKARK